MAIETIKSHIDAALKINLPGEFFIKTMDPDMYEIFPVWSTPQLPVEEFDAYLFTGDYNNITDGLLPIHEQELEFISSIEDKKVFGSCFSHQLISLFFGGEVGKRDHRFLGWYRTEIKKAHPIFTGLDEPYFLCLNVDEIVTKPENAEVLATNPKCKYQVLQYGKNIVTCQSHPEIFRQEGLEGIETHREGLLDHCSDIDEQIVNTERFADDGASEVFLNNLVEWLIS